jgi:hypothetical protein
MVSPHPEPVEGANHETRIGSSSFDRLRMRSKNMNGRLTAGRDGKGNA